MKLYVTGTPGTGKSTLALALQDHFMHLEVLEIKNLLIKFNLLEEYEPERDTTIFDDILATKSIQNFLESKDDYILVGPVLSLVEIDFDCIIVLTCSKRNELEARLAQRNYKLTKIKENIEAELLGEVLGETLDLFSEKLSVLILDSCKLSVQELISKITPSLPN